MLMPMMAMLMPGISAKIADAACGEEIAVVKLLFTASALLDDDDITCAMITTLVAVTLTVTWSEPMPTKEARVFLIAVRTEGL